jgi:S-DNA-T family DNA segregation ATPase FtsK/SpoIIIE
LILLGILGFGFGPVGLVIKKFAMFLVGEFWWAILLLTLFMGMFMLFKRTLPNFFTTKLLGLYILLIIIFVTAHFGYIESYKPNEIVDSTITNYQSRIKTISGDASVLTSGQKSINIGGGIVGAGFSYVFANLFGGTKKLIKDYAFL